MDSFSSDVNVYMRSQKHAISHAISFAVNYGLFAHGDVSYRFNGINDNFVLELKINASEAICSFSAQNHFGQ